MECSAIRKCSVNIMFRDLLSSKQIPLFCLTCYHFLVFSTQNKDRFSSLYITMKIQVKYLKKSEV